MYPIDLTGKTAAVFGVANHRSIAWDIAKILDQAGAEVILGYQNQRFLFQNHSFGHPNQRF